MDIKSVANYSSSAATALRSWGGQAEETIQSGQDDNETLPSSPQQVATQENKKLPKEDVQKIADGLNDFMASINTDIKFVLHQKMKELMVQVVDTKTHKVLREAPPKELLDTLARIRDFVGALLDKKI